MWIGFSARHHSEGSVDHFLDVANKAAQWGADQELEACCVLMDEWGLDGKDLMECRRPKPPSLAKRALHILGTHGDLSCAEHDTIRKVLEQLDD